MSNKNVIISLFFSWKNYFSQSISGRFYVKSVLNIFAFFILYHATVWFLMTSKLLDPAPYRVGDLARLGYQIPSVHPRILKDTLPKKCIDFSEWRGEPIDILTFGDSFSNGGGVGENPYYQDFMVSHYNCRVMNIRPSMFGENYLDAIVALYQSGLLEEIHPKAVLIESIERHALNRLSNPIRWDLHITRNELYTHLKKVKGRASRKLPHSEGLKAFITTANYHFPLYNFYYQFSPNAFGYSQVYKLPLTKPFFSVAAGSTLLVHTSDIISLKKVTPERVSLMNDNFNYLADLLALQQMQLIFMPAVDKYDLYQEYLTDKSYGKNPFFDLLRPMNKRYVFIDTKAILTPYIDKGVKDMYYGDDTHWSNLASEAVVQAQPLQSICRELN